MSGAAVVPSPMPPMASSSIHAGPDLGAMGDHFAHGFVGDVAADRQPSLSSTLVARDSAGRRNDGRRALSSRAPEPPVSRARSLGR